jgi:nucleoside-diphosphate-sugar epimerase
MNSFLVTGGAGFIGSNLVHALLERGDRVRVLDDFSTGRRANLADVLSDIDLMEGSLCEPDQLQKAMTGMDYCLHQGAIPSVPRSLKAPRASNQANIDGTLNVFIAARDAGVKRVTFASSSSVYGDAATYPLTEDLPRAPISPYAVTKATGELYAQVFSDLYDLDLVGLRYFNVFGPRQDPHSPYAAVIPIFVRHLLRGEGAPIFGDGSQARDFTFVDNVVHANLQACKAEGSVRGIFNIACGAPVSVLELARHIADILGVDAAPEFKPARAGDIQNSWADISRAQQAFGYTPQVATEEGLRRTVEWLRQEEALTD